MSDYLSGPVMDGVASVLASYNADLGSHGFNHRKVAATLRAYAKVVEAVAKMDASSECCQLCNAYIRWNGEGHKPDCPYLLARKLRSHAE